MFINKHVDKIIKIEVSFADPGFKKGEGGSKTVATQKKLIQRASKIER